MRRSNLAIAIAGALALAALTGSDRPGRAEPRSDDLFVIVGTGNPVAPSSTELERIFLRKELTWDHGERIIPLNSTPDSDRRRRFDRAVLGLTPDEVQRFWLDQRIRGDGGGAPREIGDPVLTVKLVARLAGTIGYVPAGSALDGVRVVARIRDGKVVSP